MKKKILLTILLVSLLACIFVISASAVTYTYNDESGKFLFSYDYTVTTATKENNGSNGFPSNLSAWVASNKKGDGFAKEDKDGNALTWYIVDTKADDLGNMTYTVKSLKTMGEAGNINGDGAYSFISPVTNKNTVSVNFPNDAGIKTWTFSSFGGYGSYSKNNVLFVYCPNTLTAFSNNPFQETPVMVVEIDDETPITSIPQNFAHEARNLEKINIPASVTLIYGDSSKNGTPFYNNRSLKSVTFASNENLTQIKNACFNSCTSLTSISLPESVKKIGNYCFASCSSLKEVSLPNSLETIANHAFAWCSSLEVIRMGNSFQYFNNTGDNSFTYTAGKVKEIYIPKSFYATAPDASLKYKVSYAFHGVSSDCKFFYCGTVEEFAIAKANFLSQVSATSNNGKFTNASVITYKEYLANKENYAKGNYVICDYNACEAFYEGEHSFKEPTCGFLGEEYVSSYVKTGVCKNCEDEVVTVLTGALFTNKGYSRELGGTYFDYGFVANREEIAKYEALTGNTVSYGIIAAKKTASESGALIDENGVAIEGAILMSFDTTSYNLYNVKVTGISSENAETQIYCSAYVYEAGKTVYIGNTVNEYAVLISLSQIEATMDE